MIFYKVIKELYKEYNKLEEISRKYYQEIDVCCRGLESNHLFLKEQYNNQDCLFKKDKTLYSFRPYFGRIDSCYSFLVKRMTSHYINYSLSENLTLIEYFLKRYYLNLSIKEIIKNDLETFYIGGN